MKRRRRRSVRSRRRTGRKVRRRRRNYSNWIPAYRSNPRRRRKARGRRRKVRGRRRRRNSYAPRYVNGRRRTKARRRRNKGRRRVRFGYRRRRNPQYGKGGKRLSMKKPVEALMAGYKLPTLKSAAVIASGALANNAVYRLAANNVPMFPEFLKDGPGEIAGKLAMAGITGAGVGMINAGLASEVFFGGVLQCVMDAFNEYVIPNVPGLSGLGDYLTRADFAGRQALGDYASVRDLSAAQNLGNWEVAVPDMLDPGLGQIATTPLNYPAPRPAIESVAAMELSSM